jgi:prepilin-type N-terminal cleavage/methylation domain-containing protein
MCWVIKRLGVARGGAGGFTLIEIIICLVLLGLLSGGVFSVLGYAARMTENAKQLALQLPQIDAALAVMHHALAHSPTVIQQNGTKWSYTRPDYTPESLVVEGTNLFIEHGGKSSLLLEQVKAFSITQNESNPSLYTLSITVLLPSGERTLITHIASRRRAANEPEKGTLL